MSCGFPLAAGAACAARCRQGLSSRQPGCADSIAVRHRQREKDGEKEKHLHLKGSAVIPQPVPKWSGPVLWHRAERRASAASASTSPLASAASLCFGFAPGFRRGSPGGGGFMHVTESDTRPGQEETVLSLSSGRAWWIPGSNMLLKTAGAGEPTQSPGDGCHSLMTDFQQCNLASARILSPAAGHEAEERQFPFFTSQRDAPQLQPFRRLGRMHPSWDGAGRPMPASCPTAHLEMR